VLSRERLRGSDELRRRTFENHRSTVMTRPWPEVDDPVGAGDHVEVVLDDDHGAPAIDEPVEQGGVG